MVLLYAAALLPVSLLPTLLGVTGAFYFFGALVLGLAYAAASIAMTLAATDPRAWRVFLVSIVYLPALLTLRSEEHTSELQSLAYLVCRLLLEKKKTVYHA